MGALSRLVLGWMVVPLTGDLCLFTAWLGRVVLLGWAGPELTLMGVLWARLV